MKHYQQVEIRWAKEQDGPGFEGLPVVWDLYINNKHQPVWIENLKHQFRVYGSEIEAAPFSTLEKAQAWVLDFFGIIEDPAEEIARLKARTLANWRW